jgi:uncharacterized protein YecT (DUF1311 family)
MPIPFISVSRALCLISAAALALPLSLGAAPKAHAYPSFDCQKARSSVETAICGDSALARADSELAAAFRAALARSAPADRARLLSDQRAWLKRITASAPPMACDPARLRAPSDDYTTCLSAHYAARIDVLKAMVPARLGRALEHRGAYYAHLTPGGRVGFSDLELACGNDRVDVYPDGDPNGGKPANQLDGRGALGAAFADCRLKSGVSVRVKAGYVDPPMAYGGCGAAPPQILSVWIDGRRVVSKKTYADWCAKFVVAGVTVTPAAIRICDAIPVKDDDPSSDHPHPGGCRTIQAPRGGNIDRGEYPKAGQHPRPVGTLAVDAAGDMQALCARMIEPRARLTVRVPGSFAQPRWRALQGGGPEPDSEKLRFNATSLRSSNGTLLEAHFDLFNIGRPETIYELDTETDWFDGTALAPARRGVLDAPFDAHDWGHSVRNGIFPFVYDHATPFLYAGKTYVLLDPALATADPRVVLFDGARVRMVCALARQPEAF